METADDRPAGGAGSQAPGEPAFERKRREIVATIPAWYRPSLHLAFPSLVGLGVMVVAFTQLEGLRWIELFTVPVTLFAALGFEWRAHKYVLHERTPGLSIIYERHELMHHVVYTHDRMEIRSSRELWLILMPAYAILLVFAMVLPFALGMALVFGQNVAWLLVATAMFFFLSYEWLHMAYHQPQTSWIGRRPIIRALREVHRRHHDPALMKRWNFNVTVPLFDWICGSLWSPAREDARRAAKGLAPHRTRA